MTQGPEWIAPPSDFGGEEEVGDIEAYWDAASPDRNKKDGVGPGSKYGHGPIEFEPLFVTIIDSSMSDKDDTGPAKSSTLLHAKLLKPCRLRNTDKSNPKDEDFPAGTIVGIWTKAGMKELKKLAGAHCWMANGQHVRGKVNYFKLIAGRGVPMVLFTIRHKGDGRDITVKNDYRQESLPEIRRVKKAQLQAAREEAAPIDLDDIPF